MRRNEITEGFRTAERLARTALAALAGVAATAGVIVASGVAVPPIALLLMTGGTAGLAVAVLVPWGVMVGLPHRVKRFEGPRLGPFLVGLHEDGWNRAQVQWAILLGIRDAARRNDGVESSVARRVGAAYASFAAGGLTFLLGVGFILGGQI